MNDTNRIHCILRMDLVSMADTCVCVCVCKTRANDAGPSKDAGISLFHFHYMFSLGSNATDYTSVDLL